MNPLPWPDQNHIQAAEGWLELGNSHEANDELERLTPGLRAHPAVLDLRWQIYAQAKNWPACLEIATAITKLAPKSPAGWVHLSFTLHELHRTQEASDNLTPVAAQFPDNPDHRLQPCLLRLPARQHRPRARTRSIGRSPWTTRPPRSWPH